METTSRLNSLRLAPRKVRAVIDTVRGKDVVKALAQLEHLIRRPAHPILKLLNSAVANAEQNFQMVRENLFIKKIFVDEGVKLKRYMPRAQGRATPIHKKISRVTIILDERVPGMRKQQVAKKEKDTELVPVESESKSSTHTSEPSKPEIKREVGKKKSFFGGVTKKMFQRKSV
ncbi:MAG: 50S ribosomal protein L22 [Patescibacteria group bacterium]